MLDAGRKLPLSISMTTATVIFRQFLRKILFLFISYSFCSHWWRDLFYITVSLQNRQARRKLLTPKLMCAQSLFHKFWPYHSIYFLLMYLSTSTVLFPMPATHRFLFLRLESCKYFICHVFCSNLRFSVVVEALNKLICGLS